MRTQIFIFIILCIIALLLGFLSAGGNDYFDSIYQNGAVMKQKSIDYWQARMEENKCLNLEGF